MTTNDTHTCYGVPAPVKNKSCVFPFNYRGKEYNRCTNYRCRDSFWCGTENTVTDEKNWGLCSQSCLKYDGRQCNRK